MERAFLAADFDSFERIEGEWNNLMTPPLFFEDLVAASVSEDTIVGTSILYLCGSQQPWNVSTTEQSMEPST